MSVRHIVDDRASPSYNDSVMEHDFSGIGPEYKAKLVALIEAYERRDPETWMRAQAVHGEAQNVVDSSRSSESERDAAKKVMRIVRKIMDASKP